MKTPATSSSLLPFSLSALCDDVLCQVRGNEAEMLEGRISLTDTLCRAVCMS